MLHYDLNYQIIVLRYTRLSEKEENSIDQGIFQGGEEEKKAKE